MRLATFDDYFDNVPKVQELDWQGFCREVLGSKHVTWTGSKEKAPLFSPAEFEPGAPRRKEYVRAVWLAVLDYDERSAEDIETLRACAAQYRSVLYSSFSHDPATGNHRVRLVFDLDRPVLPTEWLRFWQRLTGMIPVAVDGKCKDASRMYIRPYTPYPERAILEFNHDAPAISVDTVLKAAALAPAVTPDGGEMDISQPVTIVDLREEIARLRKIRGIRANDMHAMARWLEQIANGLPFAFEGSRHNTYLKLTGHLERAFPHSPPVMIADLFFASLRSMSGPDFDSDQEMRDILRAAQGARTNRLAHEAANEAERLERQANQIREAFRSERETPYTEAEIAAYAEAAGTTAEGFVKRWIVAHGGASYIFVGGQYRPPVASELLLTSIGRDLAPAMAEAGGVSLSKISAATGMPTRKTRDEILADYGTAAREAVASYIVPRSHYDAATQTIYEAVAAPRELEPTHSKVVDEWLKLMGGEHYDNLKLWLQEFSDLSRPLAALYLEGPKAAGKSLLAAGLARIWSTFGPTKAVDATDHFNDAAPRCPLVFADEAMPPAWLGAAGLGRFREFIAARERTLNRKHLPRIPLEGCMRVMFAANNLDLVEARLQLNPNDRAAILERIFHIEVPDYAAKYLARLSQERIDAFVKGDEIAKHCLWLRAHNGAARAGRFGTPSIKTRMHDEMQAAHPINSAVAQWLIRFLLDDKARNSHVFVKDGRLLVNVQAFTDQHVWERYVPNPYEVPPARAISKALTEFSEKIRVQYRRTDYRVVRTEALHGFAEQFGVMPDAIDEAVAARGRALCA